MHYNKKLVESAIEKIGTVPRIDNKTQKIGYKQVTTLTKNNDCTTDRKKITQIVTKQETKGDNEKQTSTTNVKI